MGARLSRIYTRGGDRGRTGLADGRRVAKDDLRIEAIGAVDEANAAIGLARLYTAGETDAILARIQNDLFDLGAGLARPKAEEAEGRLAVADSQVKRLEEEIDRLNAELEPLANFILPGGSPAAAHLHLARTVVRRAERRVVALARREAVEAAAVRYLNRLSDLLFVLARWLNRRGRADVLWRPAAHR